MAGCYSLIKYLVFIINLIFWLSGLSLIVISIWMMTDPFYIRTAQDQLNYDSGVYLTLAVGILLFIVGFLGCFGIIRSSKFLLALFSCVVLLILVAEISAAAWAYANSDELDSLLTNSVKDTVENSYGTNQARTEAFDIIQKDLKCCGAMRWNDWISNKVLNNDPKVDLTSATRQYKVPISCCRSDLTTPCRGIVTGKMSDEFPLTPSDDIYSEGCANKLREFLHTYTTWVIIFGLLLVITQFIGLVFSLIICCSIEKPHYRAINTRNKL